RRDGTAAEIGTAGATRRRRGAEPYGVPGHRRVSERRRDLDPPQRTRPGGDRRPAGTGRARRPAGGGRPYRHPARDPEGEGGAGGAVAAREALLREPYLRARVIDGARRSPPLPSSARRHPAPLHALNAAAQADDAVAAALLDEYLDHLTTGVAIAADVFSASC